MRSNPNLKSLYISLPTVVILFILSISEANSIGLPPWLNICLPDNVKQYWMKNVPQCPAGFFFKSPISDFCVCGHGIWQFKTDYCGKDIIIAAQDGDCYHITAPVQWIRQIGNKFDAYEEYYFVTDPTWDELRPIEGHTSPGGYKYAASISPRHVLVSCNEHHCFDVEKKEDDVYDRSQLFPPLLFNSINESDGYNRQRDCPHDIFLAPRPYEKAIVHHGMLNRMGGQVMNFNASTARSNSCQASCKVIPIFPLYNDTFDERDPAIEPNCTETENNYKDLPGIIMNQTHEQTVRLMRNHYDVALNNKKTPVVNLTEYEYFQTARQIFCKLCPEEEVPIELLSSLLRMFRVVVNESQTNYPYRHLGDDQEDARIKLALAQCLNGSQAEKPIEFVYNTTTCPNEFLYTRVNWPGAVRNFSSGLPCDLRYNTTKYDYVAEVAWKMVMFVHYFCAVHFENAGYDHSRLQYKLRNLFNREVRHRWYKQGESANLIEHIFQRYDLNRFKLGVDRCVASARDASPYRKWIWRPKYLQYCVVSARKSAPEFRYKGPEAGPITELWGGDAHCMHSFDEGIVAGWSRSGGKCLTTPVDPDCMKWPEREEPPRLVLPPPTFVNPKGEDLEKPRLIKCYQIVGDWMFEPGAEELCHLYNYGDKIIIGENLTQFDGKHCWSEYYEVAYKCEDREALEMTFVKIHDEPEEGSKPIDITIPVGRCNMSSLGYEIKDRDLKHCWSILGDIIFDPGNEKICYYINFGLGMRPFQDPAYHIPAPTFVDPRGTELTHVDEKRCYKHMGDWMFVPGNELLCCWTDDGTNTVITTWTQLDMVNKNMCFSFAYGFAYLCEHEEELLKVGFPRLKEEYTCETTTDVVPEKSPISMGHNLTDPELMQCWNILGDIIYEATHAYDCFFICFGKGMTPLTTTTTTAAPPVIPINKTALPNPCVDCKHADANSPECKTPFKVAKGKIYRINVAANPSRDLVVDLGVQFPEGISYNVPQQYADYKDTKLVTSDFHGRPNQLFVLKSSKSYRAFLIQSIIALKPSRHKPVCEFDASLGVVAHRPITDKTTQQWEIGRRFGSYVQVRNRASNGGCLTHTGLGALEATDKGSVFRENNQMTVAPCGECDPTQLFKFVLLGEYYSIGSWMLYEETKG